MSTPSVFKFRLYVADSTVNSVQARANLAAICQTHLPDQHEIEVVDILLEPGRALADLIFMTPMLIKLGPLPVCRIVGTLSDISFVSQALGLPALAA